MAEQVKQFRLLLPQQLLKLVIDHVCLILCLSDLVGPMALIAPQDRLHLSVIELWHATEIPMRLLTQDTRLHSLTKLCLVGIRPSQYLLQVLVQFGLELTKLRLRLLGRKLQLVGQAMTRFIEDPVGELALFIQHSLRCAQFLRLRHHLLFLSNSLSKDQ